MILNKIIKTLLLSILVIIPTSIYAYSNKIIAGGDTIGITINTDGVLVVGTYEVLGEYLLVDSSLKVGDSIIEVDNKKVNKVEDLINFIDANTCSSSLIKYKRNNKVYETTLKLKKENDMCKTGLYVKDSITGIGTLTYIDPNTKIFGALGHEIIDKNSGMLVTSSSGKIFESEVVNIKKSVAGIAGEKSARYYSSNISGLINENTIKGIFGKYTKDISESKLYDVPKIKDIKLGKAKILTVLDGNKVGEYEINITKIIENQETKNLVFEITDKNLLEKTGGIVQGMSGSPIIQGKYIIGAVTHVVLDTPTKGYGIFITNMLKEGEN